MIYVGIDVAKDKHDCNIIDSQGKSLSNSFTIQNNLIGFTELSDKVNSYCSDALQVKIGLEATGHYCNTLVHFLSEKGYSIIVINPLQTHLYRKSQSFRKTKTDKVDAKCIAGLLMSGTFQPYETSPCILKELKALTRYRLHLVQETSRLKVSVKKSINILFPELESVIYDIHGRSPYALLKELPGAKYIAACHLTHLTKLLNESSRGHMGKERAIEIRNVARKSIGIDDVIESLKLQQTIERIEMQQVMLQKIELEIKERMLILNSPMLTIPGISFMTAAAILAEIGDFHKFSSAEKVLAFGGLEPSIYQSGQYTSSHSKMVKRGSKYLRNALYNAAKAVTVWDPTFETYLKKKRNEGKPYNVAISHCIKKLVRIIYHLEINQCSYK